VDVGVEDGGHLSFLDSRDSSGGEEHEDGDIGFASDSVDGRTEKKEKEKKSGKEGEMKSQLRGFLPSRPCSLLRYQATSSPFYSPSSVTTSSSDDGDSLPLLSFLLVLVSPLEEELEEVPQELESDVFESERGTVEELEDVLLLRDLVKRSGLWVSEGGVGRVDDGFQVRGGDLGRRDEEREDVVREIGEGQSSPRGFPVGGEGRDGFGDVESSVGCKSSENSLGEREEGREGTREGQLVRFFLCLLLPAKVA